MSAPTMPKDAMSAVRDAATTPAKPRTVNARTLAWLAEKADGSRDRTQVLYCDQEGVHLEPLTDLNQDRAILKVRTRSSVKREPCPATIQIGNDWDAIFLTEPAVEKFLFPYYKAQRLLTAEDEQKLTERFYKADVIGIAHIAPSHPLLIFSDGHSEEVPVNTGGVRPLSPDELVGDLEGLK